MKIVKVGNSWYADRNGTLRRSQNVTDSTTWAQIIKDVDSWAAPTAVSQHEFDELKSEFGKTAESLKVDASLGATTEPPVRKITLEDPAGVDKFDTYHAPVLVKQISLEDPAGVDKFDTYHAPVLGKKLHG